MGMVYRYFKGRFTLPFLYNHARRNRGRWRLGNINGILGPAGTGGPTRGHATAPLRALPMEQRAIAEHQQAILSGRRPTRAKSWLEL
jgi:hypothetical protein